MAQQQISIETNIKAPLHTVWNAYTTPEHIVQWNFASEEWCCPHAETDLRPGGAYKARMEAKDGSFGFDFEATYERIEQNELLVMSLTDGRMVRTTFVQTAASTTVTTVFDAEQENSMEMQRNGWQAILDNFGAYVERVLSS